MLMKFLTLQSDELKIIKSPVRNYESTPAVLWLVIACVMTVN